MAFYMKMGSKSLKASGINLNGSPLPKCGDPGEDPCPPSQAAADAIAEKNLRNASKVSDGGFKETGRKKVEGGTEISYERNYNQTGTGESTGNLPSYKEFAARGGDVEKAKRYWASRSKSGKETKTRMIPDPIKLNPYGPKVMPMELKANLDIQIPNRKRKQETLSFNVLGGTKNSEISVGGKIPEIPVSLGSGSSKGSGCPGGRKNCGAVNRK